MKLDITKDLLQTEIPTNKWLHKDDKSDIIRNKSKNVDINLSPENELVMKKLIDFVRYSQDPILNVKGSEDFLRPAVGLAAPQIGSNTNMFFVRFEWHIKENEDDEQDDDIEEFAMINTKIIAKSDQIAFLNGGEGCLSVGTDQKGIVPRSYKIQVEGYDWLTKEEIKMTLRGYQAIVFQHEVEHLHGKLYYDRINQENPEFAADNWMMV